MVQRLHEEGHITLSGRPVPHSEATPTPSEQASGAGHG
jgi:cytochrome c oxidase subunit 1